VGLAGPRGPIQQDPIPGLPLAHKEVWELDWQQHSLLQDSLGIGQAGNLAPLHMTTFTLTPTTVIIIIRLSKS